MPVPVSQPLSQPLAQPQFRRPGAFLLLGTGAWHWLIWPNFLRNIWADGRSWDAGPTRFLVVHAVLTGVSLALGTAVGVIGWRSLRHPGATAVLGPPDSRAGIRADVRAHLSPRSSRVGPTSGREQREQVGEVEHRERGSGVALHLGLDRDDHGGPSYLALADRAAGHAVLQRTVSVGEAEEDIDLVLDFDAQGRLLGIEFLSPEHLPPGG